MKQRVIDCEGDQKKKYILIHSLPGSKKYSVARIYQLFYFDIYNKYVFYIKLPLLK